MKDCISYCEMSEYFTIFLIVKLVTRDKHYMSAKHKGMVILDL